MPLIRNIVWDHKRRSGAWRIAQELAAIGEGCRVTRVAKLLEKQGLKAIQPQSSRPRTTNSRHHGGASPNVLTGRDAPTKRDEVWVGDLTSIALRGGRFGYLSVLMDLYSRRIVGWEYQETMTADFVIASLQKAIRQRQPDAGLLHHRDRGGPSAATDCRAVLRRAPMRQSMSAADNCYDKAFMESCFGTIKRELELVEYVDSLEAMRELSDYLHYDNNRRRHSSLGDLTPAEFASQ